jgi:hypothetical protein
MILKMLKKTFLCPMKQLVSMRRKDLANQNIKLAFAKF